MFAHPHRPQPQGGEKDVHAQGIRGKVMKWVMGRAGAGVPSPDRIVLLRDADGDGVAEVRSVFLSGLTSPFGMALVGNELYIANADAIVKVPYQPGQTSVQAAPVKVTDLPAGANHHWTKNILASPDGSKLYVACGRSDAVAVIDTTGNRKIAEIPVGSLPWGVVIR